MTLPFHLLTESERECLRLVQAGYKSKEIAAQRNVRPDSIDKTIRSAREKLGNLTRHEAARAFHAYEVALASASTAGADGVPPSPPRPQKSGGQKSGIDPSASDGPDDPTETPSGSEAAGRDPAPQDVPRARPPHSAVLTFPLGWGGSARNELDRFPRLLAIFIVAAASALTAGATISLLYVLDRIASGH